MKRGVSVAKEVERKYIVKDESFKKISQSVLYKQGYLSVNADAVVRIRVIGRRAYITIKGRGTGITRTEYEYEIPDSDANEMLDTLCQKPIIQKYRYKVPHEGFIWEVDEFIGENEGLVVAEIELEDEKQVFTEPDFVGAEVTHDARYYNSNLVNNPYKNWNKNT